MSVRMSKIFFLSFLSGFFSFLPLYVPGNESSSSPTLILVPGDATSIQEALDASVEGSEIVVFPGIYKENLIMQGPNIILRSTLPTSPSVVQNTIIDGDAKGPVISFYGDELTTCVLEGFTLQNGAADSGGGIEGNGALATIRYNRILGNRANTSGGGIFGCHGFIIHNIISQNSSGRYGGGVSYSLGTIRFNTIRENSSVHGGGLYQCFGAIRNNFIGHNTAESEGGGLSQCQGMIQTNFIFHNSSGEKGGGLCGCSGSIQNNSIADNSSPLAGGLDKCAGLIVNCIVWGNSPPQMTGSSPPLFSCIQDPVPVGRGNIMSDPLFVNPGLDDYRLSDGSPCIDAGNLFYLYGEFLSDIDGECRLAGASVDIGADEYLSLPDSDGDLLPDQEESSWGAEINSPDSDADGLMDGVEILRGTNPAIFDLPMTLSIPIDYPSIQQALFLAFPLETIVIAPGTYMENIHLLNKNLNVQGADPEDHYVVEDTILDGAGLFSVVSFGGLEDETCSVKGLTLRRGSAFQGGGVAGNKSRALLAYNLITANKTLGDYSGGAGIHGSSGTIRNNIIAGNQALGQGASGGGLASCSGMIQGNIISYNSAQRHGGGLVLCGAQGAIQQNIIKGNAALYGGGLSSCQTLIANNVFYDNRAFSLGGGLHAAAGTIINNSIFANSAGDEGGGLTISKGTIKNCIIWNNDAPSAPNLPLSGPLACSPPSFSCIQNWTGGGTGNISSDPLLVDGSSGDFHLQPWSPCIDAGGMIQDLPDDYDGDPRPFDAVGWASRGDGSEFDMGADEYPFVVPFPSPTPTPVPSPTPFIVIEYDFSDGDEGWTPSSIPESFTAPDFGWIQGALFITSRDHNTVGFWDSPPEGIPVEENYLYRARYFISSNVPDRTLVPHIRLRSLSANIQRGDLLEISSNGDGRYSPNQDPRPYDLYFTPPLISSLNREKRTVRLSLDLVNLDTNDAPAGTVFLHKVRLERIDPKKLIFVSPMRSWNFEGPRSGGWVWNDIVEEFTPPLHYEKDGCLIMTGRDDRTFGFWSAPEGSLTVRSRVLYRASWFITTDVQDASRVPGLRLRYNTRDFQSGASMEIYSNGAGSNSPTPTGSVYRHYYVPPPYPEPAGQNSLLLSFDMKSMDMHDDVSGSLKLNKVSIDLFEIPD